MPKKNYSFLLFLTTGILLFLSGCYPTRSLTAGEEWLLKSNNIVVKEKANVDTDELTAIVKQRPNRAVNFSIPSLNLFKPRNFKTDIVLLRINLRAYNLARSKNEPITASTVFYKRWISKVSKWLENKVGEAPVIYDTLLTDKSVTQLEEYMFQQGYFNSRVDVELKKRPRKKMLRAAYVITPGTPYTVDSVYVHIPQDDLEVLYKSNQGKSVLKAGNQYKYEDLDKERQRIVALYQDNGYFFFTRDYVRFDLDSSHGNNQVSLHLNILKATLKEENIKKEFNHIKYRVSNVYVYPTYDFFNNNPTFTDTVSNGNMKIVFNDRLPINEKLVYNNIFFTPYNYSKREADKTYRSFSNLNLYKNIKVDFKVNKDSAQQGKLDSYIYLAPLKRNSLVPEVRVETRANSGGSGVKSTYNLGISGNLSFQRRNAFRNGEILKLSFSGGLEPFFLTDSSANKNFFNTTEIGGNASVTFPRFLLPISQDKFAKSAQAKTIVAGSYNVLKNDDITRKASKLSYSYEWSESLKKKHTVTIAEFSVTKAFLSDVVIQRLNAIGDPFLKNTYSDQFILASAYSFLYSDQYNSKASKAFYNRLKLEGAGNALRGVAKTNENWKKKDDAYTAFDIPFAQYVRLENEFKVNTQSIFNNIVAFRLYAGAAKPLYNARSLPFEKSFFAGGSNGIRAWGARSLGPGAFMDTTTFKGFLNRLGEIQLEANIEYRFKITKLLEWAFFADGGNIWVFKENGTRINTEFNSNFYKQLALGGGMGARFNLSFVIFRIDVAIPIHDPSKPAGERWLFQDKTEYNQIVERYNERNGLTGKDAVGTYKIKPNFNIGIGYPF